jgi:hypothetical protein
LIKEKEKAKRALEITPDGSTAPKSIDVNQALIQIQSLNKKRKKKMETYLIAAG